MMFGPLRALLQRQILSGGCDEAIRKQAGKAFKSATKTPKQLARSAEKTIKPFANHCESFGDNTEDGVRTKMGRLA